PSERRCAWSPWSVGLFALRGEAGRAVLRQAELVDDSAGDDETDDHGTGSERKTLAVSVEERLGLLARHLDEEAAAPVAHLDQGSADAISAHTSGREGCR